MKARPVVDAPEGEQLLLEVPRPIAVRIEAVTTEDSPRRVTDSAMLELRHDSPELTTAVYLGDGIKLAAGTTLRLTAHDADTGENLYQQDLTLLVDWD